MLEHAKKNFKICLQKKSFFPQFLNFGNCFFLLKNNQTEILFKLDDRYEFWCYKAVVELIRKPNARTFR